MFAQVTSYVILFQHILTIKIDVYENSRIRTDNQW